ncbi:MAG: hypothetical protein BWX77_00142 [Bacteroidetes bacterium ADurb.Bin090]|nr:MAG: hypothetical protein BWX77_00142 [Bacteroidetes bacterium ADurb.Bin090]
MHQAVPQPDIGFQYFSLAIDNDLNIALFVHHCFGRQELIVHIGCAQTAFDKIGRRKSVAYEMIFYHIGSLRLAQSGQIEIFIFQILADGPVSRSKTGVGAVGMHHSPEISNIYNIQKQRQFLFAFQVFIYHQFGRSLIQTFVQIGFTRTEQSKHHNQANQNSVEYRLFI